MLEQLLRGASAPYKAADTVADLITLLPLIPDALAQCGGLCRCALCGSGVDASQRTLGGALVSAPGGDAPAVFSFCIRCTPTDLQARPERVAAALADVPASALTFSEDAAERVAAVKRMLDGAIHECLAASSGSPIVLRTLRVAWRAKGLADDTGLDRWGLVAWLDNGQRQTARAPLPWRDDDPPALFGPIAEHTRELAIGLESGALTMDFVRWTAGREPFVLAEVVDSKGVLQ